MHIMHMPQGMGLTPKIFCAINLKICKKIAYFGLHGWGM